MFLKPAGTGTSRIGTLAALLLLLSAAPATAASVADFYKGKAVNLVIGSPAGGGYDIYGRLLALHMGDHIPGNPKVSPQNMPGAGGLRAADHIYNSAPKDGAEFGIVPSSTLMEPLFDAEQAHFDASKFSWLGSASQTVSFCGISPRNHITSFDQWLASGKELTLASSGVGAISYQHPMVMKNVLGVNLRMINGYSGAGDFVLAVERGEVDGFCSMDVSSIEGQYKPLLDSGGMKLVIQMGPHKDQTFGDIPSVFDYAKTDEQRQILALAFDQLALGRPFMAPPGIPADRYEALSTAFAETLQDPALLADAKRMKLDIHYLSGAAAKKMLEQFADYPAAVLQKAKLALGQE